MEVNQTIKTPQGTIKFQGELSQEETDFVIQVGLNYLFQQGALPFQVYQDDGNDDVKLSTSNQEAQ